jgi:ATP-dependent DNA helicase RecQ
MPDEILNNLELTLAEVPALPARLRTSLASYLLRWQEYDSAQRCLELLIASHGHLVSLYDNLARLGLARGKPEQAVETMRQRHAIGTSRPSRALEARAHLASGDLPRAQAIASELHREQPDMLLAWDLEVDLCLAEGDADGAEAALRQREKLRPGGVATAVGLARVWEARGDVDKALLWARTALARSDRDGRPPSVHLLRLLESLYHEAGQSAQSEATAERLRQRKKREHAALRVAIASHKTSGTKASIERPDGQVESEPLPMPAQVTFPPGGAEVITGAIRITSEEQVRLDRALHQYVGHKSFHPGQADVVATLLRGQSVLAVMPTGGGKSLCYQLAALLLPGTTLVISPLIALMKDQLDGLPRRVAGQATTLNSTLDGSELEARLCRAAAGKYKLVYVAPERLRQRPFLHAIGQADISLLVVDEAHCVSLWGHDFRPDYRFIATAWHEFDRQRRPPTAVPILAMTATATPRVRDDVQGTLGPMHLITTDLHRPNLLLEVLHFANAAEKKRALLAHCQQLEGSGIVYARSRRTCEDLAEMLRSHGLSALHYHAGIPDRATTQDRFMSGEVRIVVATIAFGMGVDKADVRFIIHYDAPAALENYYQEAGRAGRDGLPARCILFHSSHDRSTLRRLARRDVLKLEFLRQVYAAVKQRVDHSRVGFIAVSDLQRDLVVDETRLRVAIHFLETAGLLWRDFDLPRAVSLTLTRDTGGQDPAFARFVGAARLRPGQTVPRDLFALAQAAEMDAHTIETQILNWARDGWLQYRGSGRDMLLALPDPPSDSQERVLALLADYYAGQEARIAEITTYAKITSCRHGYISAYFGSRPIERCQSCDNCLGTRTAASQVSPPQRGVQAEADPDAATTAAILQGIAELPRALGRSGLARALQGASTSPVGPKRFPSFGSLCSWTQKGIAQQVAALEERGLLEPYRKGIYRLIRLTDEGVRWIEQYHQAPPERGRPHPVRPRVHRTSHPADAADFDQALFEDLRAWRLNEARERTLPAYTIFQNSVLERIAITCPTTPEELLAIKGIGPHKLEQFGSAILEVTARHRAKSSRTTGVASSQ